MKPILFNTEMVRAILEGRKTVTRRVIKKKYSNTDIEFFTNKYGTRLVEMQNDVPEPRYNPETKTTSMKLRAYKEIRQPYQVGDILYVREPFNDIETDSVLYAADKDFIDFGCKKVDGFLFMESDIKWKPSIHMPRKAARIFLGVKGVRAKRLQDMSPFDAISEGIKETHNLREVAVPRFRKLWDSTIDKKDIHKYGWEANPYVWEIKFERIENPEGV